MGPHSHLQGEGNRPLASTGKRKSNGRMSVSETLPWGSQHMHLVSQDVQERRPSPTHCHELSYAQCGQTSGHHPTSIG